LSKNGSCVGKWAASIAAALIGAVLVWWLGAALFWWLVHPGGLLNREAPSPVPPPHAPAIVNTYGTELYDEQLMEVTLEPGAKVSLKVADYWHVPEGIEGSCADGFWAFTWIVRSPYPEGGEDLVIQRPLPMGNGRTDTFAQGSTGSSSAGWCDDLMLFNTSLERYQVEIRHASGSLP